MPAPRVVLRETRIGRNQQHAVRLPMHPRRYGCRS
jgi:hypothetical protein